MQVYLTDIDGQGNPRTFIRQVLPYAVVCFKNYNTSSRRSLIQASLANSKPADVKDIAQDIAAKSLKTVSRGDSEHEKSSTSPESEKKLSKTQETGKDIKNAKKGEDVGYKSADDEVGKFQNALGTLVKALNEVNDVHEKPDDKPKVVEIPKEATKTAEKPNCNPRTAEKTDNNPKCAGKADHSSKSVEKLDKTAEKLDHTPNCAKDTVKQLDNFPRCAKGFRQISDGVTKCSTNNDGKVHDVPECTKNVGQRSQEYAKDINQNSNNVQKNAQINKNSTDARILNKGTDNKLNNRVDSHKSTPTKMFKREANMVKLETKVTKHSKEILDLTKPIDYIIDLTADSDVDSVSETTVDNKADLWRNQIKTKTEMLKVKVEPGTEIKTEDVKPKMKVEDVEMKSEFSVKNENQMAVEETKTLTNEPKKGTKTCCEVVVSENVLETKTDKESENMDLDLVVSCKNYRSRSQKLKITLKPNTELKTLENMDTSDGVKKKIGLSSRFDRILVNSGVLKSIENEMESLKSYLETAVQTETTPLKAINREIDIMTDSVVKCDKETQEERVGKHDKSMNTVEELNVNHGRRQIFEENNNITNDKTNNSSDVNNILSVVQRRVSACEFDHILLDLKSTLPDLQRFTSSTPNKSPGVDPMTRMNELWHNISHDRSAEGDCYELQNDCLSGSKTTSSSTQEVTNCNYYSTNQEVYKTATQPMDSHNIIMQNDHRFPADMQEGLSSKTGHATENFTENPVIPHRNIEAELIYDTTSTEDKVAQVKEKSLILAMDKKHLKQIIETAKALSPELSNAAEKQKTSSHFIDIVPTESSFDCSHDHEDQVNQKMSIPFLEKNCQREEFTSVANTIRPDVQIETDHLKQILHSAKCMPVTDTADSTKSAPVMDTAGSTKSVPVMDTAGLALRDPPFPRRFTTGQLYSTHVSQATNDTTIPYTTFSYDYSTSSQNNPVLPHKILSFNYKPNANIPSFPTPLNFQPVPDASVAQPVDTAAVAASATSSSSEVFLQPEMQPLIVEKPAVHPVMATSVTTSSSEALIQPVTQPLVPEEPAICPLNSDASGLLSSQLKLPSADNNQKELKSGGSSKEGCMLSGTASLSDIPVSSSTETSPASEELYTEEDRLVCSSHLSCKAISTVAPMTDTGLAENCSGLERSADIDLNDDLLNSSQDRSVLDDEKALPENEKSAPDFESLSCKVNKIETVQKQPEIAPGRGDILDESNKIPERENGMSAKPTDDVTADKIDVPDSAKACTVTIPAADAESELMKISPGVENRSEPDFDGSLPSCSVSSSTDPQHDGIMPSSLISRIEKTLQLLGSSKGQQMQTAISALKEIQDDVRQLQPLSNKSRIPSVFTDQNTCVTARTVSGKSDETRMNSSDDKLPKASEAETGLEQIGSKRKRSVSDNHEISLNKDNLCDTDSQSTVGYSYSSSTSPVGKTSPLDKTSPDKTIPVVNKPKLPKLYIGKPYKPIPIGTSTPVPLVPKEKLPDPRTNPSKSNTEQREKEKTSEKHKKKKEKKKFYGRDLIKSNLAVCVVIPLECDDNVKLIDPRLHIYKEKGYKISRKEDGELSDECDDESNVKFNKENVQVIQDDEMENKITTCKNAKQSKRNKSGETKNFYSSPGLAERKKVLKISPRKSPIGKNKRISPKVNYDAKIEKLNETKRERRPSRNSKILNLFEEFSNTVKKNASEENNAQIPHGQVKPEDNEVNVTSIQKQNEGTPKRSKFRKLNNQNVTSEAVSPSVKSKSMLEMLQEKSSSPTSMEEDFVTRSTEAESTEEEAEMENTPEKAEKVSPKVIMKDTVEKLKRFSEIFQSIHMKHTITTPQSAPNGDENPPRLAENPKLAGLEDRLCYSDMECSNSQDGQEFSISVGCSSLDEIESVQDIPLPEEPPRISAVERLGEQKHPPIMERLGEKVDGSPISYLVKNSLFLKDKSPIFIEVPNEPDSSDETSEIEDSLILRQNDEEDASNSLENTQRSQVHQRSRSGSQPRSYRHSNEDSSVSYEERRRRSSPGSRRFSRDCSSSSSRSRDHSASSSRSSSRSYKRKADARSPPRGVSPAKKIRNTFKLKNWNGSWNRKNYSDRPSNTRGNDQRFRHDEWSRREEWGQEQQSDWANRASRSNRDYRSRDRRRERREWHDDSSNDSYSSFDARNIINDHCSAFSNGSRSTLVRSRSFGNRSRSPSPYSGSNDSDFFNRRMHNKQRMLENELRY